VHHYDQGGNATTRPPLAQGSTTGTNKKKSLLLELIKKVQSSQRAHPPLDQLIEIIKQQLRGVARGGSARAPRALPLDKKFLEGGTELKNYSQGLKFFLAGGHPP